MHHPTAALKRFSQERESSSPSSTGNKMLALNRERVDEFIENRPTTTALTNRLAKIAEAHVHTEQLMKRNANQHPGVFDYNFSSYREKRTKPDVLHLQKTVEFQDTLGCRSRFGEGDGSFFDHWLNSDLIKSKNAQDSEGMPLLKYTLEQTRTGFKKHVSDARSEVPTIKQKIRAPYMQPYAERRKERIDKVETSLKILEAEKVQSDKDAAQKIVATLFGKSETLSPLTLMKPAEPVSPILYNDPHAPSAEDFAALTSAERENYFGDKARMAVFGYYRILSHQKLTGEFDKKKAQMSNEHQLLTPLTRMDTGSDFDAFFKPSSFVMERQQSGTGFDSGRTGSITVCCTKLLKYS